MSRMRINRRRRKNAAPTLASSLYKQKMYALCERVNNGDKDAEFALAPEAGKIPSQCGPSSIGTGCIKVKCAGMQQGQNATRFQNWLLQKSQLMGTFICHIEAEHLVREKIVVANAHNNSAQPVRPRCGPHRLSLASDL